MLQVLRPVSKKNPLTQGYKTSHKGYDHDDKPDQNYYASFSGTISVSKNSEDRNWQAFKENDPYKNTRGGKLLTADYGNYLILTGEIDGKKIKQLGAHFQPGTVLQKGTQVQAGQVIAKIGNTGNSTGSHCHTEYRDSENKNFQVEFIDTMPTDNKCFLTKEQFIIDSYKGMTGEYPTDDEKQARLQENKNAVEYIDSLFGDSRTKERALERWGIETTDTNWQEVARQYKQTQEDLKDILGLGYDANSEDIQGKVKYLLERVTELEEEVKKKQPKIIYKSEGKDFDVIFNLWNNIKIINETG